jgi:hypothetical protein
VRLVDRVVGHGCVSRTAVPASAAGAKSRSRPTAC